MALNNQQYSIHEQCADRYYHSWSEKTWEWWQRNTTPHIRSMNSALMEFTSPGQKRPRSDDHEIRLCTFDPWTVFEWNLPLLVRKDLGVMTTKYDSAHSIHEQCSNGIYHSWSEKTWEWWQRNTTPHIRE